LHHRRRGFVFLVGAFRVKPLWNDEPSEKDPEDEDAEFEDAGEEK